MNELRQTIRLGILPKLSAGAVQSLWRALHADGSPQDATAVMLRAEVGAELFAREAIGVGDRAATQERAV